MNERLLHSSLEKAGQAWLVEHLAALEPRRREKLVLQLEGLDFDLVSDLREGKGLAEKASSDPRPVPYVALSQRDFDGPLARRGEEDLHAGRVAFVLLAGGQASRLRWDGPKGTYPIGPKSDRSLFRILVEHVLRAGKIYGITPQLAVTTSVTTDAAIRAFFERNDCFGMTRSRLRFVRQGSLPALDDRGHLILASPARVFMSPDGHGGAVRSLETSGVLEQWEKSGVRIVQTFQVDNPLLRVVDPEFFGRLLDSGNPIATKVVEKTDPAERVGLVAEVDGRPAVVEYTEVPRRLAEERDPDGRLTFRQGSIAVHAFRLDFLRSALQAGLPLHPARKEIPCVDGRRRPVRRKGTKFERFIFDVFPRAPAATVVEVSREREYEALKNAEGAHSPQSVRAALEREYARWMRDAGRTVPEGETLEISPLDAVGPEDLLDS